MSPQNSPERPSQGQSGLFPKRLAAAASWLSDRGGALVSNARRTVRERALELATVLAIIGAALLAVAEFVDLYRIVSPTGGLVAGAKATQTGGDHHSYALLVIGLAVLAAALVARWAAQPVLAIAVAALGAIALAIVLIGDLPDVTSSGLTSGTLEVGESDPAVGFWLELVGALLTIGSGLALARLLTLTRAASPDLREQTSPRP